MRYEKTKYIRNSRVVLTCINVTSVLLRDFYDWGLSEFFSDFWVSRDIQKTVAVAASTVRENRAVQFGLELDLGSAPYARTRNKLFATG